MRSLKFLTWLDIRRLIRKKTFYGKSLPQGVNSIDCFSDAIEISLISSEDQSLVESELQKWFGEEWYKVDQQIIQLDLGNSTLPVEFLIEGDKQKESRPIRPFWEEIAYVGEDMADTIEPSPKIPLPKPYDTKPKLVAFYSFKGGVGRTTHLAAYLFALLKRADEINKPITVLVIDSDLEAPGLTYWNRAEKQQPAISFLDFLEAYHYSLLAKQETLEIIAKEVKKSRSPKHDGRSTCYFLPACLSDDQLLDTPILPENLTKSLGNVWTFSDAIYELGKSVGADYVMVDLRAGLSEISSPLIFDPRVQRFLVTTAASQSVSGLELVLKQLSCTALSQTNSEMQNSNYYDPAVIISFLTSEMKELPEFYNILLRLRNAYRQDAAITDASVYETRLEIHETDFLQELLYVNSWEDASSKLSSNSKIAQFAREWAATQLNPTPVSKIESRTSRFEDLVRFRDVCQQYEYAENGTGDSLLVTEPLKNLANNFRDELPRVVSIGAKGAGKTFIYVQLSRFKYWEEFLQNVLKENLPFLSYTYIFPFLQSNNLKDNAKIIIEASRREVRNALKTDDFFESEYKERIQLALKEDLDELEWTHFWILEISKALGVEQREEQNITLQKINLHLKEKDVRVILLIDGLEDIFQDIALNRQQQIALRALINIPNNKLSEVRQSNLGLIILLRRDFLRYALNQNSGQFESLYRSYDLSWDANSFLKLVYWICIKGEVFDTSEDQLDSFGRDQLLQELEKLWGEKLGGDKEARTASWVFAALTDFNGRLQARDIVRFLFNAAKITVENSREVQFERWSATRLLPPQSVRRALDPCSKDKVEEAQDEYPAFKQWVEIIASYPQQQKIIPFKAQDLKLDTETITMLEIMGVIYEDKARNDDARYYMPEIFRAGLGFNLATGARPRVLVLKRKVMGTDVL
ncbi:hypothetical protein VB774_18395 [Pseudanabaena galeata UHCC 0370]|uniref:ParA family protein n=1 Tax=Pseudanabaena galeata UHCC 0370 TaxID=3110310 RepID=A0ABU5TMS2_9CYAN|nr:hypothetical protein [Pseudanabaena galeata]MEA5479596.1 hypothetical protein [Pseudanabaena galeata UHCC 0370]